MISQIFLAIDKNMFYQQFTSPKIPLDFKMQLGFSSKKPVVKQMMPESFLIIYI
jgi:hypothetical protein